jgi:hypothetical protein
MDVHVRQYMVQGRQILLVVALVLYVPMGQAVMQLEL